VKASKTAREIRRFLDVELLDAPVDGDPLTAGVLDSLAIEQLTAFVEEQFDIVLDDADLVAENFASVDVLAALVDARRS
jgi:acyl carrier protein